MLTSDTAWTLRPVRPTGNSTTRSSMRSSVWSAGRRCAVPLPAIRRACQRSEPAWIAPARAGRSRLAGREGASALGRADRDTSTERVPVVAGVGRAAAPPRGTCRCTYGQRGAKLQPGGGLTRSGGRPAMTVEAGVARRRELRDRSHAAPRCTGGASARTACASAPSRRRARRTSPRCRRSRPATTPRSWVTRIIAM